LPPGLLIWRSLLQWIGGLGVIVLGLLILPFLNIGGVSYFKLESSDIEDRPFERLSVFMMSILGIYSSLTFACAIAYAAAGMSGFDAVNHAMTTLSTGGYSNHDNSFAFFDEPAIHWVGIIFMTIGSLPFVLFISAVLGQPMKLFGDRQVTRFLGFLALCCLAVTISLMITEADIGFGEALTLASFNVVSIVSTTGFASADYSLWGGFVIVFVFLLMVVGGCTGSTTGGIKMFRLDIAVKLYRGYIRTLILPHAVNVPQYNGRPVTDELGRAVLLYIFLYLATATALSLALAVLGMPALEAASSAFSAVGNIGPGLGPVVGPVGNFSTIPDTAKWLMSFGMLLGRLEFFTVLILFSPNFWKA
ncbi:MAG: potassium transporter TrkH, partial [Alphaproteobacteria bacterium]|nr:potassium transporter TrkH [Alphaproteobacteria bacterium]